MTNRGLRRGRAFVGARLLIMLVGTLPAMSWLNQFCLQEMAIRLPPTTTVTAPALATSKLALGVGVGSRVPGFEPALNDPRSVLSLDTLLTALE